MTKNYASMALAISFLWVSAPGCGDDDDDDNMSDSAADSGDDGNGDDGNGDDGNGDDGNGDDGNGDDGDDDDGGSVDNVGACESLIDSLSCGATDFGMYVPCDSYSGLSCDLVDYFTCLEDGFVCTDGTFDASGWANCASLAACG